MVKIYGIDENGFYVEGNDAWMNDGDTPPNFYVDEAPPEGYHRPQYVDGSWIDAGIIPPEELPKSLEERIQIAEQGLTLLGEHIEQLEQRIQSLEGN
jgi:hypothetical protein